LKAMPVVLTAGKEWDVCFNVQSSSIHPATAEIPVSEDRLQRATLNDLEAKRLLRNFHNLWNTGTI
jgi:hypothetical protein